MGDPLGIVNETIRRKRGAIFEGDIFSVLQSSPFVVRSYEFAIVDGAIDCRNEYRPGERYAARLRTVLERKSTVSRTSLIPWEAKSTIAGEAGEQKYITTKRQRRLAAFYVGICAADPSFVEVIPNMDQESPDEVLAAGALEGDDVEVMVNMTRVCRLPPSAYGGLDQRSSPYRMPLRMLGKAMADIRSCAQTAGVYVNPWTKVRFPSWKPKLTTSTSILLPLEDSDHYSSYCQMLPIYKGLHSSNAPFTAEFVGVQPYLADIAFCFKGGTREVFVEHKFDPTLRAGEKILRNVPIARGDGTKRRFYCSAFDRYDFLWYQFNFAGVSSNEPVFFFIPERELPERFFRTNEKYVDFDEDCLEQFRLTMDRKGEWIRKITQIILAYAEPRHGSRPIRPQEVLPALLESESDEDAAPTGDSGRRKVMKGRREYKVAMEQLHQRFFYEVMKKCAIERTGLLLVQARNHPHADLVYCRYRWTLSQQKAFLTSGIPPLAAHHLPPSTSVVPLYLYTQEAECFFQGPNVLPQIFRRLRSTRANRLVVWDIGGPDTADRVPRYAVIPSDDVRPTPGQRQSFERNLSKGKKPEFNTATPTVSALLSTGLYAADYSTHGDALTGVPGGWARIHDLLERFAGLDKFEHPRGFKREPELYRHTLSALHQRLVEELEQGQLEGDDDLDNDVE